MKKLSAEEKLTKLRELPPEDSWKMPRIVECPYGDFTHHELTSFADNDRVIETAEQNCHSCSRIDGAECVDEFLRVWDGCASVKPIAGGYQIEYMSSKPPPLQEAVDRMREWRRSKR